MTPKLGQYVRDTSRNGIAGTVTNITSTHVVIRLDGLHGRSAVRFIRHRDVAIGHIGRRSETGGSRPKPKTYDPNVIRLARQFQLEPEQVLEALAS